MSEARFPAAVTGAALPSEVASEQAVKRIRAPKYDFARLEAKWRAR